MVAEACLDFGSNLLRVRLSSVTPAEAQAATRELYQWFAAHDGFADGKTRVAVQCVAFARSMLEYRMSATPQEAIRAAEELFEDLAD